MKIGIMGGTFDPIHNGHLTIAEYAYRLYQLDEVWFLPNGNPPHKHTPEILKNVQDRLAMTSLAIEDVPYFKLNTYETDKTTMSFSYQTIAHFCEKYPEHHFYFILGADSLFSIESWVHPELIIGKITILAAYRDDMDTPEEMNQQIAYLNQKYGGDIRLLKTPLVLVSSHEIRQAIAEGAEMNTLPVPKKVADYIFTHNLYKKNTQNR